MFPGLVYRNQFDFDDHGSRKEKRELVELVMVDYDATLWHWNKLTH